MNQYRVESWHNGKWRIRAISNAYWEASLALQILVGQRQCCRLLKGTERVIEAHF